MSTQTTGSVQVFRLPDLGEGLTEAALVQWLVAVGDTITTDQPIAEVETAKSVVELPSPFAGVVVARHGEAGDTIEVGAAVLEVAGDAGFVGAEAGEAAGEAGRNAGSAAGRNAGEPKESRPDRAFLAAEAAPGRISDAESEAETAAETAAAGEAYRQEERAGSGNVLIGYGTSGSAAPRRRRRPATRGATRTPATPAATPATSTTPAASTTPAGGADADARRPVAVRSPLVRRLVRDLGLDLHRVSATGVDGAITRADVLRAAVDAAVDGAAAHHRGTVGTGESIDGLVVRSRERLSPLRKAVGAKLSRSRTEIPEATVWVDVDATELWDIRARMAPAGGRPPSLTALLARFVLIALEEQPILASRLGDDGSELIAFDGVNLGVATDTERGLMVPVIPSAHALTVAELDAALGELTQTARSGSLPPERLRGSTFTLNNYGGLGVDGSAAIINHPDVAILGIGRIIERPWVVDGDIVARRIVQLSLVFDHRVCDGGEAARLLRRIAELIEHPLRAFGRVR